MPLKKAIIKSGVCVVTGAWVNVAEYGKVQRADIFKVGDSLVVRFYDSIHAGDWAEKRPANFYIVLGLDGFLLENCEETRNMSVPGYHIAVVPISQAEGEIILPGGEKRVLSFSKDDALKKEYDVEHCPKCGSDQIEGHDVDIVGTEALQACNCTACEASWGDVYKHHRREVDE